ncbi:MAG: hypothetical protein PWP12_519, partial [Bacillota bacterium]|nr:hypothetical protein [Bacillota bacterium]MDK2960335.1 hypothetical protein [Bacillota bacterium]
TLRDSLALKKISPLIVTFSQSHYRVTISQSGDTWENRGLTKAALDAIIPLGNGTWPYRLVA